MRAPQLPLRQRRILNYRFSNSIMSKVVYLFGAGASYGIRDDEEPKINFSLDYQDYYAGRKKVQGACPNIVEGLPIVSELPDRMNYILYQVRKEMHELVLETHPSSQIFEGLAEDLEWLQSFSKEHSTVDTFAKKLWLTHRTEDYSRLKRTLCAYFMLEQLFNRVDKRYDAFLASILGNDVDDFPDELSILSWNYDSQFELAYAQYLNQNSLTDIENRLHFYNKTVGNSLYNDGKGFSIIKLNGSAYMYDIGLKTPIDPFFCRQGMREISYVATVSRGASNTRSALSFAWDEPEEWFTTRIKKSVDGASVLVVIGYSFPFFNRRIDRMIFELMPMLKKIYVQDTKPDGVVESINNFYKSDALKPQIIPVRNTQQFYLPPEL